MLEGYMDRILAYHLSSVIWTRMMVKRNEIAGTYSCEVKYRNPLIQQKDIQKMKLYTSNSFNSLKYNFCGA